MDSKIKLVIFWFGLISLIKAAFEPKPVGIWPMNSLSPENGVTGTGSEVTFQELRLVEGPLGKEKTAFKFDKLKKSFIKIENMTFNNTGYLTFVAFIKTSTKVAPIFEWQGGCGIWLMSPDSLSFTPGGTGNAIGKGVRTAGRWQFVAVSYSLPDAMVTFTVDEKVKKVGLPASGPIVTGPTAYIGHRPGERLTYDGYMSSAMLFDVMLTPADMKRARRYVLRLTHVAALDFVRIDANDMKQIDAITVVQTETDLECLVLCQREEHCHVVYFSDVRKECILGRGDETANLGPNSRQSASGRLESYIGYKLDLG